MMEPIQQPEIAVQYAEHQRQMAWINEHDWKQTARRSLRTVMATTLLALARRIAPQPMPEMERAMDGLTR